MPLSRSTFKWEITQKDSVYTITEYRLDGHYIWTTTHKSMTFKTMNELTIWLNNREGKYIAVAINEQYR
jgi:hypothetical protein